MRWPGRRHGCLATCRLREVNMAMRLGAARAWLDVLKVASQQMRPALVFHGMRSVTARPAGEGMSLLAEFTRNHGLWPSQFARTGLQHTPSAT